MEIRTAKERPNGSIPVFVLSEGARIERLLLFKGLSKGDRDFIGEFLKKAPLKEGHVHFMFLPSKSEAFLFGAPKREAFTHRKAILLARKIVFSARREKVKRISISLDDFKTREIKLSKNELAEIMSTQFEIANFEFNRYKTPPFAGWIFVHEITAVENKPSAALLKAVSNGKILGEEINSAREIANTPGMDMTPTHLARIAEEVGKKNGFSVKVLGVSEMKKLGMGGVLGVGQGSQNPPVFIILEYGPKGKKNERPIVLVGKGITFDSGGLNLKPEQAMLEMHMDMSGGASVIHTIAALARMGVKRRVIGLIPTAENMVSGSSYRPNDVLRTMSGKTIEVKNTDAEGRVVLSDALQYAKQYNPRLIADVATLTGAAMAALGTQASALFSTDPRIESRLRALGEKTGDFVWPLPLWEEYEDDIKGTFGDVQNVSKSRYGGAITAAVFLWQFVKPTPADGKTKRPTPPWVHIDIAPRMTANESEFLSKGSQAPAVALLTHFVREF